MPGKGKANYTGKLGDVMKESVQAAQSYVHANAAKFGISPHIFEKRDIHVHVPEGATPKMVLQQVLLCVQQLYLH